MAHHVNQKNYAVIDAPLNKRLIARLKENGGQVLIFPALKTSGVRLTEAAVEFIKNPSNFEWIIMTDVFAADYFIGALREYETDFYELDKTTVCTLGEAVADRLRFDQIHADVIPPNFNDDRIFGSISQYAGGDIGAVRFLVLQEA